MIMDSMKKPCGIATRYQEVEDVPNPQIRKLLLQDFLPKESVKWLSYLTNAELLDCTHQAKIEIFGNISRFSQEGEEFDLFCGELFDTIKDKVVEKQAYLVKNFNLEIEDEEIKSEVDDYLKRNKC